MIPVAGSVRTTRPAVVTGSLVFLCAYVFLKEVALPPAEIEQMVRRWGVVPARQWYALEHAPDALEAWLWPLFTSMFLHGGWAHLIGNSLFLWIFGAGVESRLGHGRFLLFYLLCGVAGAQLQAVLHADSMVPMIGASGAIAGVLGAYLALYPHATVTVLVPVFFYPLFFDVPALFFLGIWFLEQLLAGATSFAFTQHGGVAWWAHVGGFLAGLALVGPMLRRDRGHRRPGYRAPIARFERY